jgi:uncharacterized protein
LWTAPTSTIWGRPAGIKAAREWKVRSPLVEAGLSNPISDSREELGLSNWDKRRRLLSKSRDSITFDNLDAWNRPKESCWLKDFAVRVGIMARSRIEVSQEEFARLNEPERRGRISTRLREIGFRFVCVDLQGYRPGGISAS